MKLGEKVEIRLFGRFLEFEYVGEEAYYDENKHFYGPKPLFINRDYENEFILIKALGLGRGEYGLRFEKIENRAKEIHLSSNKLEKEIILF